MNKSKLIDLISLDTKISKNITKKVLDSTIQNIIKTLKSGEKISLIGFGTFSVYNRSARSGINPKTKEKILISEKKIAKFKPGIELNEGLN